MSSISPSPNSPAVDPIPPASNSSNSPPVDPPRAPPPQPNSPPARPPSAPPPQFSSPSSESATTLPPQSNSPPARAPRSQPNSPTIVSPSPESPVIGVTPPPLMASTPPTSPPSPSANVPPPTSPPSPPPNAPPPTPPPSPPPNAPPLTPPPSPPPNVSPPPSSPPPISPPVATNAPTSSPPPHSPPQSNPPTSSPPPRPPPNSPPPQSPPQRSPPPASPPPQPPPVPNPPAQPPSRPSPSPRSPPPPPPSDPPSSSPPPSSPPSPPPPSDPLSSSPPPSSPPSPPSSPPASPVPPNTAPPPKSSPPTPSTRPSPNSSPPQNPATPPLDLPPSTAPPSNSSPVQSPPRPSSNVPLLPRSPPSTVLAPPTDSGNNNSSNNAPAISQSSSGGGSSGIGTGGTIAIVVTISLLLLGVFGIAACCVWKRKKKVSRHNTGYILPTSVGSSQKTDSGLLKLQISGQNNGSGSSNVVHSPHEPGGLGNSRSWFTFEELVEATNGFSPQNLLGEGGFGAVYKGCLPDGMEVAVKQLKIGGGQGEREFKSEVEIISRIHHRHLVSLVGFCISDEKRMLVYDYLPNNTLYFHLHGEGRPVMDWDKRVKIAVGAARGIAYLHEDCDPRIIHRDIKSSNILLDNNFEAKVSDFGLAKLAMDANTHVTTRVMGTFGYMAPEYASSGKLTEKSDVYSFGVVLLELVTGRKPVDTSQPLGEESIVEWARTLFSHALETHDLNALADPKLDGKYVDSEMFQLIEAAAACVRYSSTKRPKMSQVVRAFDSIVISDLTNGMKVGESEIFNSAQQSEEIRLFRRMAFGSQNYSTDFFSQNSSSSESRPENGLRDAH